MSMSCFALNCSITFRVTFIKKFPTAHAQNEHAEHARNRFGATLRTATNPNKPFRADLFSTGRRRGTLCPNFSPLHHFPLLLIALFIFLV